MTRATTYRDRAHARIYSAWLNLPAWRELSPVACKLLVTLLATHRPGQNGTQELGFRDASRLLNRGKDAAGRALAELEEKGWLTVERVGSFTTRNRPCVYRLTCLPNDATGEPATKDFERWRPPHTVSGKRLASREAKTQQARKCDT